MAPRMRKKVALNGEHRIRLNNTELSELLSSLQFYKESGKGSAQLVESLIGRLSHPKAGGNWNRTALGS